MNRTAFVFTCLFITMTSEVLLSPFYPQYFTEAFGVNGVEMTSVFIICCRLVVIVMTPIWGSVLKKWSMRKVVLCTLFMTAILKFILSGSTTFSSFLIVSLLLLVFQSSLYLLYPYLVGSIDKQEGKARKTTIYLVVLHTAIIVASLFGSVVISWDVPLKVYQIFAFMDLCLLLGLFLTKGLLTSASKNHQSIRLKMMTGYLFFYMVAIFFFHLGHNVIRPYFTLIVDERYGVNNLINALLFVMPSMMAILLKFCVPLRVFDGKDMLLFYIVTILSAVALVVQASIDSLGVFIISRILYGVGFYLSMVILDIYLFRQCQTGATYYYSWLIAVQNVALLLAPLVALTVSEVSFYAPLLCGAVLLVIAISVMMVHNKPFIFFKQVKENEG
ncbi:MULTISPECIES: MFS transporter [Metabacillus]|uniref:MFS transporter n=1 Tax=Metabacillus rhizolycopersici TaxID=2875709 RepID=A0ABS7UTQ2_9BACI|nr:MULTISPECIES: MFS transporter [Metabacillus]MBZ5751687.1 MFS transporter [Metabacillus rhizolycopersici]MCM3655126.1 MFS transporter [Metabacillus litoralis]